MQVMGILLKLKENFGQIWKTGASDARVLKQVFPFFFLDDRKLRFRYLISFILVIATMLLNAGTPLVLKVAVEKLTSIDNSTGVSILSVLLAYGIIWTLSRVVVYLREMVSERAIARSMRLLSIRIFEHLHELSMRFHLERRTGGIVSAIDKAQAAVPEIIWGLFFTVIPTLIEVFIAMSILTYLYGFTYGWLLLVVILTYILFSLYGMEWALKAQNEFNKHHLAASSRIVDSLLNFETVKYFTNQEHEYAVCDNVLHKRELAEASYSIRAEMIHAIQGLIIGTGLTIFTVMTGLGVMRGTLNISDFVLVNGYVLQFVRPLDFFGWIFRNLRKQLTDLKLVMRLMDVEPEIIDKPGAKELIIDEAKIEFKDVYFGYDKRRPILKGVSFAVPENHTIAIVGPTGAGKSTISRLLFRFYDCSGGSVLVGGKDVRDVTQQSLQRLIGIVPQDTVLFNNTLRYNIGYGKPNATAEEIEKAAELAHLIPFINTLPDGFDTIVGERGLKLSGGEKQRVSIARVLLKQPKIYIFDEATSALDTKTEQLIQENIWEIAHGTTTLIIAHRLSTIVHANEILVLDDGLVAERGTHNELIQQGGLYANLWEKQIQGEVIEEELEN
ncbi:MAG: metal ABC transporter permease [Verrucomicrobia bacterium CG22_combo_CG10-13_8_21_14_all_43_17]|nr:MAG: metal ABC transporter permease [Verrucomicrobia bacterium CG22_combo_CG10-13_8_21_14_all_43_17]